MPRQAKPLVIRSEAEAWKCLAASLNDELPDVSAVEFVGWPKLHIHLDVGNASLSPTMMRAFVDFQDALWRSHALLTYGEANISYLTDEEKVDLELEIIVRGGSSDLKAEAAAAIKRISEAVAKKMTGKNWTTVAIVVAVGLFSHLAWKAHVDARVEEHKAMWVHDERLKTLESQVKLSQQETERMKLLDTAYRKVAALQEVMREADQARTSFLKHVPSGATAALQGTLVTGDVANEIAKKPRETSLGNEIEETFAVQNVDTRKLDGFRVRIRNLATGASFTADLGDDIDASSRRVIERATFEKTPVTARVEIFRKSGKIARARILSAVAAPADARVKLVTPKKKKTKKT